jgi:hypothetical protein
MQNRTTRSSTLPNFLKIFVNVLLTFLLIIASVSLKNPALPKNIAYSLFREAAKKNADLKTKNWSISADGQFEIRYQDDDQEYIQMILDTIKKDFKKVDKLLEYSGKKKVPILVYSNSTSLNKSFGWDADESAMGVYWAGIIRILTPREWLDTDLAQDDLKEQFRSKGPMIHEYTHLVVDYRTRGNYKRWFTEGIAQLIEKQVTGFQFNNVVNQNNWYSLKDLDKKFDELTDQTLAYSQSLYMVEYLVEKFGYNSLNDILDHLGRGKTLNQAFTIVLGLSLEEFEENCRFSH